jgi:23S rRNA pseudouridine2605 synthase
MAYHKPAGLLVSRKSQGGRPTIYDRLGPSARGLKSVGRLDLESEGLLLLTDDGVLAEALLHPRSGLTRVYRIRVRPVPSVPALRILRQGTRVEGVEIRPSRVVLEGAVGGEGSVLVEVREGKKREVRLLARAAGLHVHRLTRIQFGPIRLGTLEPGAVRVLSGTEVRALRRDAGAVSRG